MRGAYSPGQAVKLHYVWCIGGCTSKQTACEHKQAVAHMRGTSCCEAGSCCACCMQPRPGGRSEGLRRSRARELRDPPAASRASSSESEVGKPHLDWPRPRNLDPPALLAGLLLPPPLLPLTDVAGSDRANLAGWGGLPEARRCGCGVDWNGCSTTVFSRCRSKLLALRKQDTSGSQSSDASQQSAEEEALLLLLLVGLAMRCAAWLLGCCFSTAAGSSTLEPAASAPAQQQRELMGVRSTAQLGPRNCCAVLTNHSWAHLQRALTLPRS